MREDSTISDIGYRLKTLNENPNINAILVQMPLPDRSMEKKVMNMIDPSKDADCMTSTNIGLLMQQQAYTKPCTPAGIIELLKMNDIQIAHKNVAIFGRSNVVGRPMAELFLQENATVSILHSDSDAQGVNAALSVADIIVSTIGKPRYIERNLFTDNNVGVKILPHRILIDVGVSRVDGKIIGDFDESCYEIATYYTPYTGGVGPMTVIQLMENVLTCTRNNMK
jgi:methylenetetrahydrofolate dehydrogenase (NADP+)/methenyltetrahydrofolate cyclohydrolase